MSKSAEHVSTSMASSVSREQVQSWSRRPLTDLFVPSTANPTHSIHHSNTSSTCRQEAAQESSGESRHTNLNMSSSESKGNGGESNSAITMQDLIDSIVEESLKQPMQQSNYIRASETMFQKMLTGERSWNINSCSTDPSFDYQSRLENLSVLNNLLISMEAAPKTTAANSSVASSGVGENGASLISQMMNRHAMGTPQADPTKRRNPPASASSSSSSSSSASASTVQHTQPSLLHKKLAKERRLAHQIQHQSKSTNREYSDSSSGGERSPESHSASDSSCSLCDNCNAMKLEQNSGSEASPSSASQSSASRSDSRNSSPYNKTESDAPTPGSADHGRLGMELMSGALPPPPPLIDVTQNSPANSDTAVFSEGQSDGNREEVKHPKKRIRDRHFRETSSSGTGSDSGGSSGSENGHSRNASRRYSPSFSPAFAGVPPPLLAPVPYNFQVAGQHLVETSVAAQNYLDAVIMHSVSNANQQSQHQMPGLNPQMHDWMKNSVFPHAVLTVQTQDVNWHQNQVTTASSNYVHTSTASSINSHPNYLGGRS